MSKKTNRKVIHTNISRVNWCSWIGGSKVEFKPAEITFPNKSPRHVSWFDSLLRDGLVIPEGTKPLSILLSGPPGSGKTTFAVELCYRLAKNEDGINSEPLSSLYISIDQESIALIENSTSLGYEDIDRYMHSVSISQKKADIETLLKRRGSVFVLGKNEIEEEWRQRNRNIIEKKRKSIKLKDVTQIAFDLFISIFGSKAIFSSSKKSTPKSDLPQILIVDSLNVLIKKGYKESFFEEFMGAISDNFDIVVFVLDSSDADKSHEVWEYACDMIIKLGYDNYQDYYLRHIEIVKARYQGHVWGRQQLKIYEHTSHDKSSNIISSDKIQDNNLLKRSHPFIIEGGVFIYPSIHYYLSLYKRHEYSEYSEIDSWIKTNKILGDKFLPDGLPRGRCTAFIGARGGHKSHLGYLICLSQILTDSKKSALIISLRDDEKTTITTLNKIMKLEMDLKHLNESHIDSCIKNDRLEVLYFHPGYITPEEFFHRIFVTVQQMKKSNQKNQEVIVLFNSLDQLSSRFPLCAKQEIFIPGIIEFLSGEGVTSIFIAVDEPGQPIEQYGLLPMADLILSFYPKVIGAKDYFNHIRTKKNWGYTADEVSEEHTMGPIKQFEERMNSNENLKVNIIALQVVRFAGGKRAGEEGILELVDNDENRGLYPWKGLHFTEFNPAFDTGELTYKKKF